MIEYVVGPNDTLNSIADFYDVTIDEIINENNLTNNKLEEGMVLKIPVELKIGYYTVLEGDDLYSIANKFGISIETLSKLNGLKVGEYIYPNQKLIVPLEGYRIYITKSGDTVTGVQNDLNVSFDDLIKENSSLYLLPEQLVVYKNKK